MQSICCANPQSTTTWYVPQVTQEQLQHAEKELMRLGSSSPAQAAALQKEWSSYQLGSIPGPMAKHLPSLTERECEGEDGPHLLKPVQQRRNWWRVYGKGSFPLISKVASRLLSMHVTTCASERDWSLWGNVYVKARNRLALEKAERLIFVKGNLHLAAGGGGASQAPKPDVQLMLEVLEGEEDDLKY